METLLINGGKLKPGIKGIAFQLLHSTIHAGVAYLFVAEWTCWIIPAVIFVTHFMIDFVKCKIKVNSICTFLVYETKSDWITERNKNLIRPTHRPKERDCFYNDVRKLGYKKWAERYFFSESFLRNIPVLSHLIRIKYKLQRKGENV